MNKLNVQQNRKRKKQILNNTLIKYTINPENKGIRRHRLTIKIIFQPNKLQ